MESILKELPQLEQQLSSAEKILIATGKNPTADSLGASLALFLALENLGKKVTVSCPSPVTVEFSHMVGLDRVKTDLGGKNFVISLDNALGTVEKVSYYLEGEKLNLVIHPSAQNVEFTPDKIHFSYNTGNFNLIFVVGAPDLKSLENLYQNDPDLFAQAVIVNIDNTSQNTLFGKINIVEPALSSVSEIILFILRSLNIAISEDLATNILLGIKGATLNLQNDKVNAQVLETLAFCLKAGAKWGVFEVAQNRTPVPSFIKEDLPQEALPDDSWLSPKIYRSKDTAK